MRRRGARVTLSLSLVSWALSPKLQHFAHKTRLKSLKIALFLAIFSVFAHSEPILTENSSQNAKISSQNSANSINEAISTQNSQNSTSSANSTLNQNSNSPTLLPQNSPNDDFVRYVATNGTYTSANEPSKFSVELGLGYVNAHFTGKQSGLSAPRSVKSTTSHGIDIFVNGIYQPTQYFGFSFGLLWEFLPISWQGAGLMEPESVNSISGASYNSSEFVWNAVLTLGFISDIYKSGSNSVRLFANIGAGTHYLLSGNKYEGEASSTTCGYAVCTYESTTLVIPFALALPVNFGARFTFAKSHGIELVGKIELTDKSFDYEYPSQTIKTTISRDFSVGLRYVYRFQF